MGLSDGAVKEKVRVRAQAVRPNRAIRAAVTPSNIIYLERLSLEAASVLLIEAFAGCTASTNQIHSVHFNTES